MLEHASGDYLPVLIPQKLKIDQYDYCFFNIIIIIII